jgi:DNA invertase Pin-like site-specific DNA recombinase
LIERTILGLEHARRSGKTLGRPKIRDDAKIIELRSQGLSYTAIQKELGISRGAISRAMQTVPKTPEKMEQKSKRFQWS